MFKAEIDKVAFRKDVESILQGTYLWDVYQTGLDLHWPPNAGTVKHIVDMARSVVAGVEVAKQRVLANYPPGTKFDAHVALDTAIQILDDMLVFSGALGSLLDKFDRPILEVVVESVLSGYRGINWLGAAKAILGVL